MANTDKYQRVYEQKKLHPEKPLTELCEKEGVSYQAYYLWAKKQQEGPLGGGQKTGVRVMVSVRDMVQYLATGTNQITLPVHDVLRSMSPEEQAKVALELGKKQLEDLLGSK
jgi:hypothetical protein